MNLAAIVAEHKGSHYCLNGRHNEAFGPCLPYRLASLASEQAAALARVAEQVADAWDEGEAAGRENQYDSEHPVEFQEPWTNPYRYAALTGEP